MKLVGIVVALLGVWLGAAGGFGEARLRGWEERLRGWIRSRGMFDTAFSGAGWVRRIAGERRRAITSSFLETAIGIGAVLLVLGGFGVLGVTSGNYLIIGLIAAVALVVFLVVLPIIVYILAAAFALALWLIALPYLPLDRLTRHIRYQSTLLLLGVVFSTIGILLAAVG